MLEIMRGVDVLARERWRGLNSTDKVTEVLLL